MRGGIAGGILLALGLGHLLGRLGPREVGGREGDVESARETFDSSHVTLLRLEGLLLA